MKKIIALIMCIMVIGFTSCQSNTTPNNVTSVPEVSKEVQSINNNGTSSSANVANQHDANTNVHNQNNTANASGKLKVHFIDVGQADSILIQDGTASMLIDAGNNTDANTVVNYIKKQGISKLDVVVGTHPHEDHIGGLDAVINTFSIGKIYMPKVSSTTKTYLDVLNAIKNKGLKVTTPVPNTSFKLNTANATILAPNSSSYEDLNNYSIAIKLVFGNTSFLFTGDAENISENEMISKGFNLSADVLKVGHHGSSSSTSTNFLNKVNPKYAVIMVGKDNSYGHPHRETMDKLKSRGIKVFRTDENGTIIAESDGNTITFNVQFASYSYRGNGRGDTQTSSKSSSSLTSTANTNTSSSSGSTTTNTSGSKVYVDANGRGLIKGNINSKGEKIYHLPGGAYYDRTKAEVWFKTEAEAKAAGFRPSSR